MAEKKIASKNSSKSTKSAAPSVAGGKVRVGQVVSAKMEKTIVVSVMRLVQHAKYGKYQKSTKKYYVHDEKKECGPGDTVRIVETRPLSRLKRWRVIEVLNKAVISEAIPA